jgi:hypothetical protein
MHCMYMLYTVLCRLEQERFAPTVAGRMIGGVLLTSIMDEFAAAMTSTGAASNLKLHMHSADYPVSQTACTQYMLTYCCLYK